MKTIADSLFDFLEVDKPTSIHILSTRFQVSEEKIHDILTILEAKNLVNIKYFIMKGEAVYKL